MTDKLEIIKKNQRKSLLAEPYLDYGKLPPQVKAIEEVVLGAVIIDSTCMMEVGRILKPEMFYVDAHQRIFQACVRLFVENSPIDLETVVIMLKKDGNLDTAGGPFYVAQLTNKVGSSAHAEYHATLIKEEWIKRMTISISTEAIKDAYEDTTDCHEVLGTALTNLSNLSLDSSGQEVRTFSEILNTKIETISEASMKKEDEKYVIGKATGLYTLDRKSLGYKDTNLIILAGRPAEGKSTLMVQGAHINARKGIPVGIFSLEMSCEELMDKFISAETNIDSARIQTGALKEGEWNKLHQAQDRMKDWPIFINDSGGITINDIEAISKAWRAKNKIQMLFVDYLQLVEVLSQKGSFTNREQELAKISRRLKKLAKDLGIPVIALSQLSREMDKRPVQDRRPKLTDLRESGAIEQDANMVIFVFRPEEHGITTFSDQSPTKGVTEFIIAKNRMGPKGVARAVFIGSSNRFDDSDYSNFTQEYVDAKKPDSGDLFDPTPDGDTPF